MVGRFSGRDIVEQPTCPFCHLPIEKPEELDTRRPGEMPVGACSCGAVYACDVTGHNLGTAMIEALVFSCNGDWDLAWDLLPEEDYLESQVTNYDCESHLIVHGNAYGGRHIRGTLYFIKLHDDIRDGGGGSKTGKKGPSIYIRYGFQEKGKKVVYQERGGSPCQGPRHRCPVDPGGTGPSNHKGFEAPPLFRRRSDPIECC